MISKNVWLAFIVGITNSLGCMPGFSQADKLKLQSIAEAALNYRQIHGNLPPVLYTDGAGQPAHSWRVTLVSYIEANGFFDEYDFGLAWNEGGNAELVDGSRFSSFDKFPYPASVRSVYQHSRVSDEHHSNFAAVIIGDLVAKPHRLPSSGVAWQAHHVDNPRVFFVVELTDSGIHWLEPRDICLTGANSLGLLPYADVRGRIIRSIKITHDVHFDDIVRFDREATLAYLDDLAKEACCK